MNSNKKLISFIVFFILLIIFINAFSSSYISHNIVNLAYVIALGIDVGENAKIRTSAQFVNYSSSSGSDSSSGNSGDTTLVSAEGDSVFSSLNILNSYIGKEINLSHCSVVVFSEEFAKQGISIEIYSLINNEEFRPTTNLVVSNCDAYDYLSNINPNIEKLATKYYDTFSITNKFTGYISDITVGEFYNNLNSDTCDGTAILGGINSKTEGNNSSSTDSSRNKSNSNNSGNSSSEEATVSNEEISSSSDISSADSSSNVTTNPEDLIAGNSSIVGKRASENIGLAVFNEDKYCGELTAMEALCHLLIKNDVDSCIISIDNPLIEAEKMELNLFCIQNSEISVNLEKDTPVISIVLEVDADILTLNSGLNYQSNEILEKISIATEEYLKKEMNDYLNKVSKKYGTDIDNFGMKATARFNTISEWKEYNWSEKFKTAEFNLDIAVNVVSSLLVTKT